MGTTVDIRGIKVDFPFQPYDIQTTYMEKVIECLQNETNGVLESPTGTGKTLSLLCSSLAWLQAKKAQLQAQQRAGIMECGNDLLQGLKTELEEAAGRIATNRGFLGLPTIIYASRTHSQLSQAMQELKRTHYRHMKAVVLGSRDQLCIHPEVLAEQDRGLRVQLCRVKMSSRACQFYNRVDRTKEDPAICNADVIDIEDMVKLGEKLKFCPYFMTKEIKQRADIVFAPYNYLVDPMARKALGLDLENNIIILDEAHNVEKICEDSASIVIKSIDIALAMEEITAVMKMMETNVDFSDSPKDFTADELILLKGIMKDFEEQLDAVDLTKNLAAEGTNFPGDFVFELLGKAGVTAERHHGIMGLIDKIIQYLATVNEGPYARKGKGLQVFVDFLAIVFAGTSNEFKDKIKKCYRVHISVENQGNRNKKTGWLSKMTSQAECRVLSYWCFSPGFGMNHIMACGVRSLILTSGTLAPLKPLISELELDVPVRLENPHIVDKTQICVKIVPAGPDMETLNSNYQNRDNAKYVTSLGRSILNLSRIIPGGLLIFFPSYPVMEKCRDAWQNEGLWSQICQQKQIYVEPRDKNSFNSAMKDYYEKIADPKLKGAIFMGVCRGKVSEGLDFANENGRAVIITGLPYPPLKDPRVILKRRYLDQCNAMDREFLKGEEWYSLEATRAVNQAIGRVIRHEKDYGAILLLDTRFSNPKIVGQMSKWLRDHIKPVRHFGEIIGELSRFFRNAQATLPSSHLKPNVSSTLSLSTKNKSPYFNFGESENCTTPLNNTNLNPNGLVEINKRSCASDIDSSSAKRKKIIVIPNRTREDPAPTSTTSKEFLAMVKRTLDSTAFQAFVVALQLYKDKSSFQELAVNLDNIFVTKPSARFIIRGLETYIKDAHKDDFELYWSKMR